MDSFIDRLNLNNEEDFEEDENTDENFNFYDLYDQTSDKNNSNINIEKNEINIFKNQHSKLSDLNQGKISSNNQHFNTFVKEQEKQSFQNVDFKNCNKCNDGFNDCKYNDQLHNMQLKNENITQYLYQCYNNLNNQNSLNNLSKNLSSSNSNNAKYDFYNPSLFDINNNSLSNTINKHQVKNQQIRKLNNNNVFCYEENSNSNSNFSFSNIMYKNEKINEYTKKENKMQKSFLKKKKQYNKICIKIVNDSSYFNKITNKELIILISFKKGCKLCIHSLVKFENDKKEDLFNKILESLNELIHFENGIIFLKKTFSLVDDFSKSKMLSLMVNNFARYSVNNLTFSLIIHIIKTRKNELEEEKIINALKKDFIKLSYNTNGMAVLASILDCFKLENKILLISFIAYNFQFLIKNSQNSLLLEQYIKILNINLDEIKIEKIEKTKKNSNGNGFYNDLDYNTSQSTNNSDVKDCNLNFVIENIKENSFSIINSLQKKINNEKLMLKFKNITINSIINDIVFIFSNLYSSKLIISIFDSWGIESCIELIAHLEKNPLQILLLENSLMILGYLLNLMRKKVSILQYFI